jgi:hypothetical protein
MDDDGTIQTRRVTPADRRAAIIRAAERQGRIIRISEGIRRAIVGSAAYRAGRLADPDAS